MNANHIKPLITQVGGANFESEVIQSKGPVLVAFLAPWSHPCHVLDPVLVAVATACSGNVKVVKINADDNPDLSLEYDVQSVPTLLYFARGNLRGKIVGTASKEAILSRLEAISRGDDAKPLTRSGNKEHESHGTSDLSDS